MTTKLMKNNNLCACGLPLHYTDKSIQNMVQRLVDKLGEYIPVRYIPNSKTYLVQRHYIALHGLEGKMLPDLGFSEAPSNPEYNPNANRGRGANVHGK